MNNPILAQIQGDRDVSELREGIYLRSSTTRLVKASLDDPSIPDGAYVVNDDGSAIFAIDTRGQIYALTSDVGFDYDGEGQLRVTFEKEGVGGELVFVADGVVVSR